MEDPELFLLQRISSLELPASEIAAQINARRVQVTDTSQPQLFRGDCVNQAFMDELLQQQKTLLKDSNKKKRLARTKKHEQWTLD